MATTTGSFGFRGQPNKKSVEEVDYGGRELIYWINVQKMSSDGIDPKKLIEEGHITLEEVSAVFGEKKQNGYKARNLDLLPEVKKRVDDLYRKFYPSNGKVTNNEYGRQLCWGIVAERKGVKVCWAALGLKVAKKKARRDQNIGVGEDGKSSSKNPKFTRL